MISIFIYIFISLICLNIVYGATKSKKHGHDGVLEIYDGKPIPYTVSDEQAKKLDKGDPVTFNERIGKSGRGVVIQDVNASQLICMDKIRDLASYHKMVPKVKKVTIYDSVKFVNGTSKTGAEFQVGVFGLKFGYYLLLTHEPKYQTLTWTLDYKYNSDFDDNVGHWQVMPHPKKSGWTRVLYSTKVKLFNWIPEFVVNFLTGKALIESTTWLKKEAELEALKQSLENKKPAVAVTLPKWFSNGGAILHEKWTKAKEAADKEFEICKSKFSTAIKPNIRSPKTGKFN